MRGYLHTRIYVATLLLVLFIGTFIYAFVIHEKEQLQKTPVATDLSKEQYELIKKQLVEQTELEDPKKALSVLEALSEKEAGVLRICHPLAHEVGRAAYSKYTDFGKAMVYKNEICNSGYLHGVIESYFKGVTDMATAVETVCNDYLDGSFIAWECYHGVGHGLMFYSDNNLPPSLLTCSSYTTEFRRSACINGVFMENFNTDQKLHPSRFLKATDPFYPCADQKQEYKGDCYLYAPTYFLSLHKNKYHNALSWCRSAEKAFRVTCIQGVGAQTMKEQLDRPVFVESVCSFGTSKEEAVCIAGAVDLYINHYGSPKPAKNLCMKLEKQNQAICNEVIKQAEDTMKF